MNLSIAIKTNLAASGRETPSPVLSYALVTLMGIVLSGLLLASVVTNERHLSGMFIGFLLLYEYVFVNARLRQVNTILDGYALSVFPLSRMSSVSVRFLLFTADKRMILYALPMLCAFISVWMRMGALLAIVVPLLFAFTYLVISEIFFMLFLILKALSHRFGVRTVTDVVSVLLFVPYLALSLMHVKFGGSGNLPVVSEFVGGFQGILTLSIGTAYLEITRLALLFVALAAATLVADSLLDRPALHFRLSSSLGGMKRTSAKQRSNSSLTNIASSRQEGLIGHITDGTKVYSQKTSSLISLEWKILQKEEKFFFVFPLLPVMIVILLAKASSHLQYRFGYVMLAIFFVTQILGFQITEGHLGKHGLRLKHLAIFPFNVKRFVLVKTISAWSLVSLANLSIVAAVGILLRPPASELAYGAGYSICLPLVLVQLENTLALSSRKALRGPAVAILLILPAEFAAAAVYAFILYLGSALLPFLVLGLFLPTYVWLIPAWAAKVSSEMQTLLEDPT